MSTGRPSHPPRIAEFPRKLPSAERARRAKPVYWLDAERPMLYKLGRTEKQISSKYLWQKTIYLSFVLYGLILF